MIRDDIFTAGTTAVFGNVKSSADFHAISYFPHVDECVGVGECIPFIQWASDHVIEHRFVRCVKHHAAE